jgi:AraC-like DNA-binding protein/mannose-6-phosphate isomerase-like protein (cupin superfamily)
MAEAGNRALYQCFLPDRRQRTYVWKYSQTIGGRRPRHFHAEPELNLVVRGSATFAIGGDVTRVSRGELVAFPPGQDHALIEGSPDLYLYAVGLDPAHSADVLGVRRAPVVPLHVRLSDEELELVSDRATSIVDRAGADQLGAELWERVHWLARRSAERRKPAPHVLTRRALGLLESTPELGLDALSSELRAHPSDVSRHFHRDVGMTLVRYRTRLRLLQVIRLVDAREYDLMGAASAAGFGSYSQCHRTFHAELGCAPRAFFSSGLREQMQSAYDD